jgi:diguanylate cyclase (GGDEF)-like protein
VRYAAFGNVLPIAIAVATDFGSHPTVFFVGAIGGCIAPIVVNGVTRRHPVPFYAAAYGGLLAITMMQAHSGGAASGYSILLLMAMIWFGLQGSDREILAGGIVLAACAYLPMLVIGPPAFPVHWGNATLLVLIGFAVAGSLRAVTRETARLTSQLRQQAVIDDLTGLLNRRGWCEAAERGLARAARARKPVGLVLLDLDGLKELNDSMGHDEGDRLLRDTADRMRATFRAGDVLARLGGDEFVALLGDSTLEHTLLAVERLREATPPVGAFSAGVAVWEGDEELDDMLRRVDAGLYAAKTEGGGRTRLSPAAFDPSAL